VTGEEFDPLKLIKRILGKPDEPKPAPVQSERVRPEPVVVEAPPAKPEPPPTPRALLHEALEKMPDDQRLARMVELGKLAAGTGKEASEALQLIDELCAGTFFERRLVLFALQAGRDHARMFRVCSESDSRALRKLATSMSLYVCSDEELGAIAAGLTGKPLRRFLARLAAVRRTDLVDLRLKDESADGDVFNECLAYCSPSVVAARFKDLADKMAAHDFLRVARRHPSIVSEYLHEYACGLTTSDVRFRWLFNAVAEVLTERDADAVLGILRAATRAISIGELNIHAVLRRRSEETTELLLEQNCLNYLDASAAYILPRLSKVLLSKVLEEHSFPGEYDILARLLPEQRRVFYDHRKLYWRDTPDGAISTAFLEHLPADIRVSEARRIVSLPSVAGDPVRKVDYAAFLPWQECLGLLHPLLSDSDGTIRSRALGALVQCVRYDRAHLADVLNILVQRNNEPDSNRAVFLRGLSMLPPGMWTNKGLNAVERIVRHSLDSSDVSTASLNSIAKLAERVFPFHSDWSVGCLLVLWKERGSIALGSTYKALDPKLAARLDGVLIEAVKTRNEEDREQEILQLARILALRLKLCPVTVRALESVARTSAANERCIEALRLLESWHRPGLSIVPGLVQSDSSWGLNPIVLEFLSARRQELLTPYLGQQQHTGRFRTGGSRIIPNFTAGFDKWTTEQQQIYMRELEQLAMRPNTDISDAFFAIDRLCKMPEPSVQTLRKIASRDNEKPAVRDYAIARYSQLDNTRLAVPLLLECLHDERVRKAVYALRTSILNMNRLEAISTLKRFPVEQVTVYKEVVRLAGDVGGPEAFDWLISLARTALHTDVKAAVIKALWNFCDPYLEVWETLEEAAQSPERALALAALDSPAQRASEDTRKRMVRIFAILLRHDDETVRVETLRKVSMLPFADTERAMLRPVMSRMSSRSPVERSAAANLFFTRYASDDEQATEQVISELLKNRRNLLTTLQQLEQMQLAQPGRMNPVSRAVLRALWGDPLTTVHQMRVAFGGLPANDFARFLRSVEHGHRLHAGAVHEVVMLCAGRHVSRFSPADMDKVERVMFNKRSEGLRRIGLAFLEAMGRSSVGWSPERLARLISYRRDTSPLVASAAEFVLPSVE
jgi:hypothetical protein